MLGQILVHVSHEIERFGEMARKKPSEQAKDFKFEWNDITADLKGNVRDQHLAQYVQTCKHLSKGHSEFSCCTDKAQVRALPLQVTAIGLPNNIVWVAPPAAFVRNKLGFPTFGTSAPKLLAQRGGVALCRASCSR